MTTYIEISADMVEPGVRFDVERARQGQMVEVAYGGHRRSEHCEGDEYKRVVDHGVGGGTRYYRRQDKR